MGVIIKDLSVAKVSKERGSEIEFELNENPHAPKVNGVGGVVHIQSNIWRIEMFMPEFVEFADACVRAGYNLKKIKGIKDG
mgnify:CR=1 FL=1